jgi:hypothetical protein
MKLYELIIDSEETDGVFQLSFVDDPAIQAWGTFFNKEEVRFAEVDEYENLFIAPILIPERKILRIDGEGNPYEVYLSKPTVKRLSQLYLEKKYQDKVSIEHDESVDGVVLTESWIKESATKDKSLLYNLSAPVGSWIGTFRITNPDIQEKFKSGEISAVSIEGLFTHELVKASRVEDKDIEDFTEEEADEFLRLLRSMIFGEPSISSSYPGEVAEEMITPNPCQEGYVAIGTKQKDGREVPNCVPTE